MEREKEREKEKEKERERERIFTWYIYIYIYNRLGTFARWWAPINVRIPHGPEGRVRLMAN